MSTAVKTKKAVKEFLASYSPNVRETSMKTRAYILDVIPNAVEQVDPGSKIIAYGFGLKMADIVCAIAPHTAHVNLMFSRGTELPDPEGLLEGTGKRARHVKLKSPEDLELPGLRALLDAAVAAMKR
jgi:hypothetical protein